MTDRISSSHIHRLQAAYNEIGNRGICIDKGKIELAKIYVDMEIAKELKVCTNQWNCHVFVGKANEITDELHPNFKDQVNLNASSGEKTLLAKLQDIGYKLQKVAKLNDDTGEYESKFSAGELTLQKALVANQFGFPGGDPAIRAILAVRELQKLRSSYLSCRLYKHPDGNLLYLSSYNAAGALTGRRSSKKHTFGFGNNAQNFPKHGRTSKIFRRCLVARPGNIFLMVDQKSAEEWPVNALAANIRALDEMRSGVNRHIRRASGIFGISEPARTEAQWKESIEYYLGKKTGHANNYGMRPNRMSDSLAQEGHSIPPQVCEGMLKKLNQIDPNIQGVFHTYVRAQINSSRILITPFGRERQFLGLRPNDSNYKVFNEAYAFIPQSTVGDNTGFAVSYIEDHRLPTGSIVQEGHDSIVQDIKEDVDVIWSHWLQVQEAFNRVIRFDNGLKIQIPIEAEIGFNFKDTVKIKEPITYETVADALRRVRDVRQMELDNEIV